MWNWTGFYIGAHAGYGGDKYEYPLSALGLVAGDLSLTSSGGFAGGQIGYNWQAMGSPWVFGIEADIAWAAIKGELTANIGPITFNAGSELEWFGTLRGRIGYSWDRFMLYGTGGLAYGSVNSSLGAGLGGLGGLGLNFSTDKLGWTAGGGFEYGLSRNWSVKTEYLYLDLGKDSIFASPLFSISEQTTVHTIKAGINYRFATR